MQPYLLAEFAAANLWSMALFVGNPTNIIVAQAYKMSFVGYSKWMLLPTLGGCLLLWLSTRCCALRQFALALVPHTWILIVIENGSAYC